MSQNFSPRDIQFAGFAKLLLGGLMRTNAFDMVDVQRFWGEEDRAEVEQIMAQRAHDLATHAVGHTLEYLHECGHPVYVLDTRIISSIPDLDDWSKWGYKDK